MKARASAADIDAIAAEWLSRMDRRDLTEGERAELDAWLGIEPRHRGAFIKLEAAWFRLSRIAAFQTAAIPNRNLVQRPWVRVTAAACIAGFIGLTAIHFYPGERQVEQTISTEIGAMQRINEADGSRVEVNTASRVEVVFTQPQRHVRLVEGEANFEVAKDAQRPFVVEANGTTVTAVGTRFDIRKFSENEVDVVVIEGAVDVQPPRAAAPLRLAANYEARITNDGSQVYSLTPAEVTRRVAWRDGQLIFAGETLAQAADEFGRYNSTSIKIADPSARALSVGGVFRTNDVQGFVQSVAATFGLAVTTDLKGFYVLASRPKPLQKSSLSR